MVTIESRFVKTVARGGSSHSTEQNVADRSPSTLSSFITMTPEIETTISTTRSKDSVPVSAKARSVLASMLVIVADWVTRTHGLVGTQSPG